MPDMLVRLYDLPEIAMAEYLAGLRASVFVMDYDHNAPDAAYLKETHERLYRIYRSKKSGGTHHHGVPAGFRQRSPQRRT